MPRHKRLKTRLEIDAGHCTPGQAECDGVPKQARWVWPTWRAQLACQVLEEQFTARPFPEWHVPWRRMTTQSVGTVDAKGGNGVKAHANVFNWKNCTGTKIISCIQSSQGITDEVQANGNECHGADNQCLSHRRGRVQKLAQEMPGQWQPMAVRRVESTEISWISQPNPMSLQVLSLK